MARYPDGWTVTAGTPKESACSFDPAVTDLRLLCIPIANSNPVVIMLAAILAGIHHAIGTGVSRLGFCAEAAVEWSANHHMRTSVAKPIMTVAITPTI